jgi:formylglycine-generating enzyme required for sulfatase activity
MHGNVSEWVLDCFWHGYFAQPVDGSARTSVWSVGEFAKYNLGPAADCGLRRLRGGSWSSFPRFVRSANREGFFIPLNLGASDRGFRVARTLDEK